MSQRSAVLIAAVLGFLAVVAGTFGAHVLRGRIDPDLLETYEVGVRYHMYHALAILACAALAGRLPARRLGWAVRFFTAGVAVFAGSLYLLVISGARWLGMITPLGGVMLLLGWLCLAGAALGRGGGS